MISVVFRSECQIPEQYLHNDWLSGVTETRSAAINGDLIDGEEESARLSSLSARDRNEG